MSASIMQDRLQKLVASGAVDRLVADHQAQAEAELRVKRAAILAQIADQQGGLASELPMLEKALAEAQSQHAAAQAEMDRTGYAWRVASKRLNVARESVDRQTATARGRLARLVPDAFFAAVDALGQWDDAERARLCPVDGLGERADSTKDKRERERLQAELRARNQAYAKHAAKVKAAREALEALRTAGNPASWRAALTEILTTAGMDRRAAEKALGN